MGVEGPVWAVAGLIILVLLVSFVLTLPGFVESKEASAFRTAYEKYVDSFVISLSTAFSLIALAIALGAFLSKGTSKDLYVLGALFIISVKSILLLLDATVASEGKWLVESVAHLFDLLIVTFLLLAVREG